MPNSIIFLVGSEKVVVKIWPDNANIFKIALRIWYDINVKYILSMPYYVSLKLLNGLPPTNEERTAV